MRFKKHCLLFLLALTIIMPVNPWQKSLHAKIDNPISYKVTAPLNQSLVFKRIQDGKIIYSKNPDQVLSPASVTKLITAAACFDMFGSHHTFQTPITYTGNRRGHKITGNIYIKGSGDPLLISELIWQLATDIRNMGIRQITGDIVIDNSSFDSEIRDHARISSAQRSRNAYDAPITPFAINYNTFTLSVGPNPDIGSKALVTFDPYPLRMIAIENYVTTARHGMHGNVRAARITKKNRTSIRVKGSISTNSTLKKIYRSVSNPVRAAGEQVRGFLLGQDIIVQGQVKSGKAPKNSKLLIKITGYPLYKIMSSMNKYSNNYIADVMTKNLGSKISNPASFKSGLTAIQHFMQKIGVKGDYKIYNGSGLSPNNRLSANQVTDLLMYVAKKFRYFPEFLASLPVSSRDGTLKDRFAEIPKGAVRAKTGSLTEPISVSSLAGYLNHKTHGLIAFAIIDNGKPKSRQPSLFDLRKRQDHIIKNLLK